MTKKMTGLQIQTVSSCSARCIICPHGDSWLKTKPGFIEDLVFNKIMAEVKPYQFVKICPYLMNEPLGDPKIFEKIERIKSELNYEYLELSTNASYLNAGKIEKMIDAFGNVDHEIWISFHGTNAKTYSKIMLLDFDKTLQNVKNFLHRSDGMLNVKIRGAGLPFMENKTNETWFSKEEYYTFWKKIFEELKLRRKPEIQYYKYNSRAGNINKELVFEFLRHDLTNFKCYRTSKWFHFLHTGELALCCNDYHREGVLGDIRKNSLDEILKAHQRTDFIDKVEGRKKSPNRFICKRCTMVEV